MRRLILAGAATLFVATAVFVVATGSEAQIPPIPILPTTTAAPEALPSTPPTQTTSPPTTSAGTDSIAPVDSVVVPDISLPTDTLPAATEPLTTASSTPTPTSVPGGRPRTVALPAGLRAASVSGAYGIGFATVLAIALALATLTTVARSQLQLGGSVMTSQRRARLLIGVGCLALAAIVGLIGYLKLSLEPDVNRQIPYLASAGMALVLLSAVGGAFIVGEQMRTDAARIDELETAVQHLAAIVAPTVEDPPRTRSR
ncbi:MAG: hypothetical protein H0W70_02380 [Actinobacteria bacterium]|nr:hypothetical protein [Actinomycetota bacterium]